MFGTLGGIFGLLSSACAMIVGVISSQILLSSVFRRLYFTNPPNFESIAFKILSSNKNKVKQIPEEIKTANGARAATQTSSSKYYDASSNNDILVKVGPNHKDRALFDDNVEFEMRKLKATLRHRRRYQAN